MWAGARRLRGGDLNIGSTGLTVNALSTGTNFSVTATQLGLVTIERVLDIRVASENPVVADVTVVYQLISTSTAIGGTVTSASGTTVNLEVLTLGY